MLKIKFLPCNQCYAVINNSGNIISIRNQHLFEDKKELVNILSNIGIFEHKYTRELCTLKFN